MEFVTLSICCCLNVENSCKVSSSMTNLLVLINQGMDKLQGILEDNTD